MRTYAKAFFAFAMLGTVGACSETSTLAPASQAPAFVAPANFLQIGTPEVFRVYNSEGIVRRIGNHVLYMPAGSICDLFLSGYGSTSWDKPCDPLRGSVLITATVFAGPDGRPYVDFQPAMRFAPGKEVMLFLLEGRTDGTMLPVVEYCNNLGYCVDESIADASLRPFRITGTSIIGRRVKHFSGYTIAYNEECTGTIEPIGDGNYQCNTEGMGGGIERRSGYMVASGENIVDLMVDEAEGKDEGKPARSRR